MELWLPSAVATQTLYSRNTAAYWSAETAWRLDSTSNTKLVIQSEVSRIEVLFLAIAKQMAKRLQTQEYALGMD
jgi:hypothetical protein